MKKAAKAIRNKRQGLYIWIIAYFISHGISGCGVQTYPYLAPPDDSGIDEPLENEKLFSFSNYTNNSANYFLGYELYYKFYASDIGASDYENEIEMIESTPTFEKVTSLGYRRVYNRGDIYGVPLLQIDSEIQGESFKIAIDFRFITESIFPQVTYIDSTTDIARYIHKSDDVQANIYNFNSENINDSFEDISSSIYSGDVDTLYLSLYVFSYGKYEVFNELYSKAAHLGKITIQTENSLF